MKLSAQLRHAAQSVASLSSADTTALCDACREFLTATEQEKRASRQNKTDAEVIQAVIAEEAGAEGAAVGSESVNSEANPSLLPRTPAGYSQVGGGEKEDMRRPAGNTAKPSPQPMTGGRISAGESHTVKNPCDRRSLNPQPP